MCTLENYSCASPFIYSSLPQSLEKMVAGKKQTTHGCSGTVFSNGCYNCISCASHSVCGGKPDKGSRIHLRKEKPIFSWLIVGILFSTGCTPLAQMTNFHLYCSKIWGEGDLHTVSYTAHWKGTMKPILYSTQADGFILCSSTRKIKF